MTRAKVLKAALFAVLLSVILVACGGPTAPSTDVTTTPVVATTPTPTTTQVMAPPPAGLSAERWKTSFYNDLKLYRVADGQTIHFDISALSPEAKVAFTAQVAAAQVVMTDESGKVLQQFDTTPVPGGVNYVVTAKGGAITCSGVPMIAGACTTPTRNLATGEVTGGKVEFTDMSIVVQSSKAVIHEIFRTTGIVENAPVPSIMAAEPVALPTEDDKLMLRGRYKYPPLAVYAVK